MKYRLSTRFQVEFEEIQDWFAQKRPSDSLALLMEVREAIIAVQEQPFQYSRVEDGLEMLDIREFYIKRFQYRLIYSSSETELVYLALVHARQRPGTWAKSLTDDNPLTG